MKSRQVIWQDEMRKKGLCYICANPVLLNYKVCEKHHEYQSFKNAKKREYHRIKSQEFRAKNPNYMKDYYKLNSGNG